MILGILSDSHGDAAATARAVSLLEERGAQYFVHCGDICGEDVLAELAGRPCTFVWGNCDSPTPALRKYVEKLGLSWPKPETRIELAEKGGRPSRIGVFHGHELRFADAGNGGDLDYIFYGHTHQYADMRTETCRLINPGALYRARPRTCALLDLASARLSIIRIDNGNEVDIR